MLYEIRSPIEVLEWFHAVVNNTDREANEMPYFQLNFVKGAHEAIFCIDGNGVKIAFSLIMFHYARYEKPCIMATYTNPEHRGNHYGQRTIEHAIERIRHVTNKPRIAVEIETAAGEGAIRGLSDEFRECLDLYDPDGKKIVDHDNPLDN